MKSPNHSPRRNEKGSAAGITLIDSENRYRRLFETAKDGILILDAESGLVDDVNPFLVNLLGYSKESLLQKKVWELGFMKDIIANQAHFAELQQKEYIRYDDRPLRAADGRKIEVEFVSNVYLANGQRVIQCNIRDISERKRAELAQRLSSAILRSVSHGVIVTTHDQLIISANAAYLAITGYPEAEVLGRNCRFMQGPDTNQLTRQEIRLALLADREFAGEILNYRKDGTPFWNDLTISPVRDPHGIITHFVGITRDMTERKQAEAKRQEIDDQYRALVEKLNMGLVIHNAETAIVLSNPMASSLLRLTTDQMRGKKAIDPNWCFLRADGSRMPLAEYPANRLFISGEGFSGQVLGISSLELEEPTWVTCSAYPVRSPQGRIVQAVVTFADITGLKRAEDALRLSEENYRLLFKGNPLPMWVHDFKTYRFLAVNEAAVRHYGYTQEEFLAITIRQICNPEDEQELLRRLEEDRNKGESTGTARHRRKDGTTLHVETMSKRTTYEGKPARLVLVSDVTERKLIQDKFLHAQRLESVGMLAAGIAHDLNNVLAPIMLTAPMLRGHMPTPRDTRMLDMIERSATRGAGLVKQILGFVRTATSEFQPTQVKHLARDIISVLEETLPKSIRFEHAVSSALWVVQGNATQIHQVLMNLCVNARDAMPSGGTLRFSAANCRLETAEAAIIPGARAGTWLRLEVSDTGTGISPEVLENIWTPFFTTKQAGQGTGLGLSTVRSIALGHQGFIDLHTFVGRGTTIAVYLPASTGEPDQTVSAPPAENIPCGQGQRILVADDEPSIRDAVTDRLAEHGYKPVSCVDGMEALALFYAEPNEFSLVITDVDMPRLGGLELAKTIRQLRPNLPIIAMSGLSSPASSSPDLPVIQTVVSAFMNKPFQPDELLTVAHRLLNPTGKT